MSRNLSIFLCILVVIGIQSACVQPSANTDTSKALLTSKTSIEIPKLLNRNPKLYQGKEWDDVQNYYEALVGTLKAAKKRGLIDYKGTLLLKGVSDKVVITIKE